MHWPETLMVSPSTTRAGDVGQGEGGNTRTPGIDPRELALLADAGLDAAAILDALTHVPASVFGFDELGALEEGRAASFLLVRGDPRKDVTLVASPEAVFIDGQRR